MSKRYELVETKLGRYRPLFSTLLPPALVVLLVLPIHAAEAQSKTKCGGPVSGGRLQVERIVVDTFYAESPLRAGDPRVGIMANSPEQIGICTLGLFVARHEGGMVCVRVVSRDARFWWLADIRVAAGQPGLSMVSFQTRNASLLAGIAPRDLAILAAAGPTCPTLQPPFVVGTWGARQTLDTVRILVNTDATAHNVSLIAENGSAVYRCDAMRGISFQVACAVPIGDGHYVLRREDAGGRRKPDVSLSFGVP